MFYLSITPLNLEKTTYHIFIKIKKKEGRKVIELDVEEVFLENEVLNLVIDDEEIVNNLNYMEDYDINLSAVQYPEYTRIFEILVSDKRTNENYKISIEFEEKYMPLFQEYFENVRHIAFTDTDYKYPEKFFYISDEDKLPWMEHFEAWNEIITLERMLKREEMEL